MQVIYFAMSGRRKFRLTAPKNWLRKKYAARQCQSLPVSIPLERLSQLSLDRLCCDLETQSIPLWVYHRNPNDTKVQVCKMDSSCQGHPPKVVVCLEIQENMEWAMYIWSKKLDPSSHPILCSHPSKIRCVSDVLSLLKTVDGCTVCVGSNDEKFDPIVKDHKGIFNDPMGKAMYMYNDIN